MTMLSKLRAFYRRVVPLSIRQPLYKIHSFVFRPIVKLTARQSYHIQVALVDHCNLDCRSCSQFSPLAPERYLDISAYERDIARLRELMPQLRSLYLFGGEPLLHPQLLDFLTITRKYFDFRTPVAIITNGVLLLKQSLQFWQICSDNHIELWVSNYPLKIDYQQIEAMAKQYSIIFKYNNTFQDNTVAWGRWPFKNRGGGGVNCSVPLV